jgi:hypothetical protein
MPRQFGRESARCCCRSAGGRCAGHAATAVAGAGRQCVRARCVVARVLMLMQVRFDACDGFEFTQELCVFDMCKIGLFHCWVYDPHSEPDVAAAMGRRHYNEVRLILFGACSGADLRPQQAVLAMFNSLGAGSPPPASHAAAAASPQQDTEQLAALLSQASVNYGDSAHDRQQPAAPVGSAAVAGAHPHADAAAAADADAAAAPSIMSAAAAGDRIRIREWMQVRY